ncbi:MAG: plasmid recombination protein [Oscillospiraceae bacterium]|nr:plasmid recombination protein [Oscillospiraceae bacterium]
MPKTDFSCVRVKQYGVSSIGASERHNERKNDTYSNINVDPQRIPYNVHFKDPGDRTYMEILTEMEEEGMASRRGLRPDATLFDELVLDVNTMYFDRHGGYEYAKQFYEEAYHFLEKKFGPDYILSAVMHADEINKAATDELGVPTYHYHMHAIVVPVVDKEICWSKRCKDPSLRGTVKEVIHQISHSKKWASTEPMTNDHGEPVFRSNGKPKYRPSYSILQDEFIDHMREAGYRDFERGALGSTSEHLTSLQYQIQKDSERLSEINEEKYLSEQEFFLISDDVDLKKQELNTLTRDLEREKAVYEPIAAVNKTRADVDAMGKKSLTGKISLSSEEFSNLKALAVTGVDSKTQIESLKSRVIEAENDASFYRTRYYTASSTIEKLQDKLDQLQDRFNQLYEKCKPFLQALEQFPSIAKLLITKVQELSLQREVSRESKSIPQPNTREVRHRSRDMEL